MTIEAGRSATPHPQQRGIGIILPPFPKPLAGGGGNCPQGCRVGKLVAQAGDLAGGRLGDARLRVRQLCRVVVGVALGASGIPPSTGHRAGYGEYRAHQGKQQDRSPLEDDRPDDREDQRGEHLHPGKGIALRLGGSCRHRHLDLVRRRTNSCRPVERQTSCVVRAHVSVASGKRTNLEQRRPRRDHVAGMDRPHALEGLAVDQGAILGVEIFDGAHTVIHRQAEVLAGHRMIPDPNGGVTRSAHDGGAGGQRPPLTAQRATDDNQLEGAALSGGDPPSTHRHDVAVAETARA